MSSLSPTTLLQNALTAEERSRVLVLYTRGLRLLFTVGSAGQTPAQWAAAWEAVYRELLALALTRHQRLSETVRVATHHFFSPTYQFSHAQGLAFYQVMAQRLDTETQGLWRLARLTDASWLRRRRPRRHTAKVQRRRGAHRKKLRTPEPRKQPAAGVPQARGGPGTGGAAPVQARVEELLAWVRRVMERPHAEDMLTLARDLLTNGSGDQWNRKPG
jgi:hypothetical protein